MSILDCHKAFAKSVSFLAEARSELIDSFYSSLPLELHLHVYLLFFLKIVFELDQAVKVHFKLFSL